MNTRRLNYWLLLFLIASCFNAQAQDYPPLYCLAVKQQFSAWSECGANPYFRSANVKVGNEHRTFTERTINNLNSTVALDGNYLNTGSKDAVSLVVHESESDNVSKITINTSAGGILNDNYLTYNITNLEPGANEISAEASDPCSNNANWRGRREGYIMTTTVYVDDPVDLYCDDQNRAYSAEEGYVVLKTGNFYKNSKNEYELQVSIEGGTWSKVPATVFIEPNKSYVLKYEDIAGKKSVSGSNYFKWMGKSLKFQVVKTLLSGAKSAGEKVNTVRFYPRGLQFKIQEIKRSFCEPNVKVRVELDNKYDKGYVALDSFYWVAKRADNTYFLDDQSQQMLKQIDPSSLICEIDFRDPRHGDVFNHPDLGPGEWLLQLQEKNHTDNIACVKSFVIPPKPDAITLSQTGRGAFPITFADGHTENFDIHDLNHPYVMLKIEDKFFYQRKPYIVVDAAKYDQDPSPINNLDTINELPSPTLTPEQITKFKRDSAAVLSWENGAYKAYFQYRYQQWINAQTKDRVEHPLGEHFFKPYLFHSHEHTHSCTHSHIHSHFCVERIPPGPNGEPAKYSCIGSDHTLCDPDPHNLCNNNHTHCPYEPPGKDGIYQSDNDLHTHSVKHEHIHSDQDINHNDHPSIPAYNDPNFNNTEIRKYLSANPNFVVNYLVKVTGSVTVSLETTGYSAKYILRNSSTTVSEVLWNEVYIKDNVYPNTGVAFAWFNDYMKMYKDLWVSQNLGAKVSSNAILVNQSTMQTLKLIDKDGCPYPVDVQVKAPREVHFSVTDIKDPGSACANNGEAKITYFGGGITPYNYGNQSMQLPNDFVIATGLSYGLNQVKLYDIKGNVSAIIDVKIDSPNTVASTSQTCLSSSGVGNGKVTITVPNMEGDKTYTLTSKQMPSLIYTAETAAKTHTFRNLTAGEYDVLVDNGVCTYSEVVTVSSKVFGLAKPAVPTKAFKVGDLGGVTIEFANRQSNVIWDKSTAPLVFNPSDNSNTVNYTNVVPKEYKTSVSHTVDGETCTVPVEFTIEVPQFKAKIDLEMEDRKSKISASLEKNNSLIIPYQLTLIKHVGSVELPVPNASGSSLSVTDLADGDYVVRLIYGSNSNGLNLYPFTLPLDTIKNMNTPTGPTCEGGVGSVLLTPSEGIIGGIIESSDNGIQFTSNMTYQVPDSTFTYFLRSKKSTAINFGSSVVTVNEAVVEEYSVKIPQPKPINGTAVFVESSCANSNNGKIYVRGLSGGSGEYLYRVKDVSDVWNVVDDTVKGLSPNAYKVYIKDKNTNCQVLERNGSIFEPQPLAIDRQVITHPTCELENGAISVEVKGGNGAYKYKWLLGSTNFSEVGFCATDTCYVKDSVSALGNNLKHGTYSLTVEDVKGCKIDTSIILGEYKNPILTDGEKIDALCYNNLNGKIIDLGITKPGTLKAFYLRNVDSTYFDTIQAPLNSFTKLKADSYLVTVKDTNNCKSNKPLGLTIGQPKDSLRIKLDTISPVIAKYSPTGSISATITGGNDGLKTVRLFDFIGNIKDSVSLENNPEFQFKSVFAGRYRVNVIDNKGCNYNLKDLEVIEPIHALRFTVRDSGRVLCKAPTGFIKVQAHGGWGGYTFKRTGIDAFFSDSLFENLYGGTYKVTVKDNLGAEFSRDITILEPKDSLRSRVSLITPPTCSSNGAIDLEISGGTAPYRVLDSLRRKMYISEIVDGKLKIAGLSANDYTMRIFDANNCQFDLSTNLPNSKMLRFSFGGITNPTADGIADGGVNATVLEGAKPYAYQWKGELGNVLPETTSELKGVNAGLYKLTVTDNIKCSVTDSIYLAGLYEYPFTIVKRGDETKYGAKNGYAKLTSEFKSWSNFEINMPNYGKLLYKPGDNNPLISYDKDTLTLRNLGGGNYFIRGVTTDGVRASVVFWIEPYEQLIVSSSIVKNVNRKGDSDGKIVLTVAGGGGGNKFYWEQIPSKPTEILQSRDDDQGSVLSGVAAGDYRCIITDCYGNAITSDAKVLEPQMLLKVSINRFRNETCKDSTNAFVELKASGGWERYQFKDDLGKLFTHNTIYSKLKVGEHKFYTVDGLGVVDSIPYIITEPLYLRSSDGVIDSVNCYGEATGEVMFHVTGGTKPYKFAYADKPTEWFTDTIARKVKKGDYNFIVSDDNNCKTQNVIPLVTVHEPDLLLFSKIDITHTTCNTDNGKIEVSLKGGSKPYSYEWLDGFDKVVGTSNSISNLAQNGQYRLKVLDRNNCEDTLIRRIKYSSNPTITNIDTTPALCYGGNTGTALVKSVKTGIPYAPYTVKWENGDSGDNSSGYKKGTYSVEISDTNKCSTISYFNITQPDSLQILIKNQPAQCFGYNNGALEAQGFGGVGGYTYKWSTGAETSRIENLIKGNYTLNLYDANKCLTIQTFPVNEPEKLEVDLGKDIKMCPGNTRVIDGQDFVNYEWSTSAGPISTERYLTVRDARDYFLKVTDLAGCFAWDTINLSIGNDALKSDFILTSQAEIGDTLIIFELSNMALDSMKWGYNPEAFMPMDNKTGLNYMLMLKAQKEGIHNIDLSGFSGGCVSLTTKQVEIIADSGNNPDDDGLGYKDPLIKSFTVSPNPTDGNFYAVVKLRESSDITLILFSIAAGAKLDERYGSQQSEYNIGYNLSNLNTGIYLLVVKAQNERKQVKIIIQ